MESVRQWASHSMSKNVAAVKKWAKRKSSSLWRIIFHTQLQIVTNGEALVVFEALQNNPSLFQTAQKKNDCFHQAHQAQEVDLQDSMVDSIVAELLESALDRTSEAMSQEIQRNAKLDDGQKTQLEDAIRDVLKKHIDKNEFLVGNLIMGAWNQEMIEAIVKAIATHLKIGKPIN